MGSAGHPGRLRDRPRPDPRARGRPHRAAEGRPRRDRHHRAALPGQARAATTASSARSPTSSTTRCITGIRNIADQSRQDRACGSGSSCKRGEIAKVVLNNLYKHTPLQSTFGANMVALVDGVPRTLGLKALLRHYVDHQKEVVTRRTKFRLDRAERRAHILEGYLIALEQPRRGDRAHPRLARRRGGARRRSSSASRSPRSRPRPSSTCACSA